MLKKIKSVIKSYDSKNLRNSFYRRDIVLVKSSDAPELSKNEFQAVKDSWPIFPIRKKDVLWHRIYKKELEFSPNFLCDYPYCEIWECLNPIQQTYALQNKGMVDVYFTELPWAKVYVKKINGIYYNSQMDVLTEKRALEIILSHKQFIIKPSIGTGCGMGVKKVILKNIIEEKKIFIKRLFDQVRDNFVVQEVFEQSDDTSIFNNDCVNSCRITSIYINGRVTTSGIFKVGKPGSNVDNWHSSIFMGISKDGFLKDCGFDNTLKRYYATEKGVVFKGKKINCYHKLVSLVEEHHPKYFPNCGIIGWDLMLDKDNQPKVIEVNLYFPGILGEQLGSGPFFEERREEILKRVRESKSINQLC